MAESILCEEGMYLWEMTLIGMLEVSAFFHDEKKKKLCVSLWGSIQLVIWLSNGYYYYFKAAH